MIRNALCLLCCLAACMVAAPAAPGGSNGLFDAYGFIDFTLFPPHNEQDLGLRGYTPNWGIGYGYDWFGDSYPRYGLEANLTLELRRYKRAFIFINPYLPMGQTTPQVHYGWSLRPIGVRLLVGVGYHLTNHFDIILQSHNWEFFGKYRNAMLIEGPYGQWNGITARYRFDTRER